MEKAKQIIFSICRFCLTQDGLLPLTRVLDYEFSFKDIEHYTGLQITDEEQLFSAICEKCCNVLESSVAFRAACVSNDASFKQLFSSFTESIKGDPIAIEDQRLLNTTDLQFDTNTSSSIESVKKTVDECYLTGSDDSDHYFDSIENNDPTEENETKQDAKAKQPDKPKELCYTCGMMVQSYTQHSATHSSEKRYSCAYCDKKFAFKYYRKLHIESVHEKKVIKSCEICGTGFTHRNSYTDHMVSKHGIGKKYDCEVCFKSFNRVSHYNGHFKRAHGNEEYPCEHCDKIFRSKARLRVHQSVHSDDRPYACNHCPKRFKGSNARKTHELTHTGIRFECALCKKSYGYKTLLNIHYRKDHPNRVVNTVDSSISVTVNEQN